MINLNSYVWNISFIAGIFLMVSCSQDADLSVDNVSNNSVYALTEQNEVTNLAATAEELEGLTDEAKEQRNAALLLAEFVSLKNNEYILEITSEEAEKLGITAEIYSKISSDLETSNAAIKKAIDEGHKLNLTDIKKELQTYKSKKYTESRVIDPPLDKLSGVIGTSNNEWGHDSFYPPFSYEKVYFRCRTNAALIPVYTCKVHVFGETKYEITTGSLFVTTEVWVPLAASGSGLCADLWFQTTDSNGGSATWKAL